jgi:hypothetical protein
LIEESEEREKKAPPLYKRKVTAWMKKERNSHFGVFHFGRFASGLNGATVTGLPFLPKSVTDPALEFREPKVRLSDNH